MRTPSLLAAGLLSVFVCGASQAQSPSAEAVFEREEPAGGLLTLSQEDDAWRISIRAGGVANGAATAADCELQAVGQQDLEGVIAARLVPFEGELGSLSVSDIGDDDIIISVNVGPEGAFVEDTGGAARFCGLGSDIEGFYRRTGMID